MLPLHYKLHYFCIRRKIFILGAISLHYNYFRHHLICITWITTICIDCIITNCINCIITICISCIINICIACIIAICITCIITIYIAWIITITCIITFCIACITNICIACIITICIACIITFCSLFCWRHPLFLSAFFWAEKTLKKADKCHLFLFVAILNNQNKCFSKHSFPLLTGKTILFLIFFFRNINFVVVFIGLTSAFLCKPSKKKKKKR